MSIPSSPGKSFFGDFLMPFETSEMLFACPLAVFKRFELRCSIVDEIRATSSSVLDSDVVVFMLADRGFGSLFSPSWALTDAMEGLALSVFALPAAVEPRFADANDSVPCFRPADDLFFGAIVLEQLCRTLSLDVGLLEMPDSRLWLNRKERVAR